MTNRLREEDINVFLDKFEQKQFDKKLVLDFMIKLINSYYLLEKESNEQVDNLKSIITNMQSELSTLLINSVKQQEFLNSIFHSLKELKSNDSTHNYKYITKLENQILNFSMFADDVWEYLFNHFLVTQNLNLKKYLIEFNLSDSEFKVCALCYLEFPTKTIAKILNLSPRSIDSQKYRIRKKLGIVRQYNINEFLNNITNTNKSKVEF